MGGSTLLVVDDDVVVRESLALYLQSSGYNVIQADDGEKGLGLFKIHAPDLILCDLRMPVMDGLMMLEQVRKVAPDIPFIVVSGVGVMTDVLKALHLGATDFLVKPLVDLEVLEYTVKRGLEKYQLLQDNRNYRASLEQSNATLKESLALLEQDHQAGRQVQINMQPNPPLIFDGVTVAHKIYPSLYLSGDFVDYFVLDEHSIAFYLADVSGHGASSAFVTVLLKHMTMNLLQHYDEQGHKIRVKPSQVLHYINHNLLKSDLGKHVTLFGGIINTSDNTLTYSLAGQYPLPIMAIGSNLFFLEGRALPLGLTENAVYKDQVMDLPERFTLTAFSDGILELLPQKSTLEKEHFLLSLMQEGCATVDQLSARLRLDQLEPAPDDVAILTVSR